MTKTEASEAVEAAFNKMKDSLAFSAPEMVLLHIEECRVAVHHIVGEIDS